MTFNEDSDEHLIGTQLALEQQAYQLIHQGQTASPVRNIAGGDLYAIIFNGSTYEPRFRYDKKIVYSHLQEQGTVAENITVLDGDGSTVNATYPATLSCLEKTVEALRQRVTHKDRLLVFVTNHGDRREGLSYVCSNKSEISEKEFSDIFADLPFNFGVFCFGQCYSGAFAQRMGVGKNIGISQSGSDEMSIGDIFGRTLIRHILDPSKKIAEAFVEAANSEKHSKHSLHDTAHLYWQDANPAELYLHQDVSTSLGLAIAEGVNNGIYEYFEKYFGKDSPFVTAFEGLRQKVSQLNQTIAQGTKDLESPAIFKPELETKIGVIKPVRSPALERILARLNARA